MDQPSKFVGRGINKISPPGRCLITSSKKRRHPGNTPGFVASLSSFEPSSANAAHQVRPHRNLFPHQFPNIVPGRKVSILIGSFFFFFTPDQLRLAVGAGGGRRPPAEDGGRAGGRGGRRRRRRGSGGREERLSDGEQGRGEWGAPVHSSAVTVCLCASSLL